MLHTPCQIQLNQPVVDRIGMCLIPSFEREKFVQVFLFQNYLFNYLNYYFI